MRGGGAARDRGYMGLVCLREDPANAVAPERTIYNPSLINHFKRLKYLRELESCNRARERECAEKPTPPPIFTYIRLFIYYIYFFGYLLFYYVSSIALGTKNRWGIWFYILSWLILCLLTSPLVIIILFVVVSVCVIILLYCLKKNTED